MALKTADRVWETTTTQGTGSINLGGAIANFRTFAAAIGNGNRTSYMISDNANWEIGIGTVTTGSPNTLSRGVLSSSNANQPVNWGPGTRNVVCVQATDTIPTRDENLNFIEGLGDVGGLANALTFTLPVVPKAYSNGMKIRGYAIANNAAGALTINVNSLGNKNLKVNGLDPAANLFTNGQYFEATYRTATGLFELTYPVSLEALMRAKAPPTISNNTTDTNNYIDIAAGTFTTDAGAIVASSAITKRLNAVWAVGNNVGGLDTGSKAATTNYSVWAIYNPATAVLDYLFSTSATSPTMPSGFTDKRRIGWIRTDGSSNILAFTQIGDDFRYTTPVVTSLAITNVATTVSLPSCPVNTTGLIRISSPSNTSYLTFRPTTEADGSPNGTTAPLANIPGISDAKELNIRVNSSSQIIGRSGNTSVTCYFGVLGWNDKRGRDD